MDEQPWRCNSPDRTAHAPTGSQAAGDLLGYLTERGFAEAEYTVNVSGKNVITYHLTAKGLRFLDKLFELLELLWNQGTDFDEAQ